MNKFQIENVKTIVVTDDIVNKLNEAVKVANEFETITGKQLNITSILGEILTCKKYNMKLVVNDINEGFDAIDSNNKRVQIKTRRFKGVDSALTGTLLNKNFNVSFDYAVLVLLEKDYSFKADFIVESEQIKQHFDRINQDREKMGKGKRKTMSISQFKNLTRKTIKNGTN